MLPGTRPEVVVSCFVRITGLLMGRPPAGDFVILSCSNRKQMLSIELTFFISV
jgi:hypothetical protein